VDRSGTLLYDADCGICVATATWLAERVPPTRLGLLALQQVGVDPRIAAIVAGRELPERLHFVRSDGAVLTGARAALAAGRLVPRWRLLAILADHPVGHVLLEPLYRQIAAHRRRIGRLLGLPAECPLPMRVQGAA
jgi:predicted DCC family thiol-disulfide oxidoreductase YuxK